MTIERIPRLALTLPLRRPPERLPSPLPADAGAAVDIADDAVASRLQGLALLGRPLVAGERIAVRVLSTSPAVELQVDAEAPGLSARPSAQADELSAAMQPDQLLLRHLRWRAPGALDLATALRTRVFRQITTELARADSAATGTPSLPGEPGRVSAPPLLPLPGSERWIFPVHLNDGQQARLFVGDDDDAKHTAAAAASAVLLIEIELPGEGMVQVRLQIAAGVHLQFRIDGDRAVAHVRDILPALAAALVLAGTRLASCRLLRVPAGGLRTRGLDITRPSALHAHLPLPLFRVAAEVLLALTALQSGGSHLPAARTTQPI